MQPRRTKSTLELLERVLAAPEQHPQRCLHLAEEATARRHVQAFGSRKRRLADAAGRDEERQISPNQVVTVEPLTAWQEGGVGANIGSGRKQRRSHAALVWIRRRILLGIVLRLFCLLSNHRIPLAEGGTPLCRESGPATAFAFEPVLLTRAIRR